MIRIVSVALPKSSTNLAQGDEVPQIITRITRQRPSEILHLLQNDFCNTIGTKPTACEVRSLVAVGVRAHTVPRAKIGREIDRIRTFPAICCLNPPSGQSCTVISWSSDGPKVT